MGAVTTVSKKQHVKVWSGFVWLRSQHWQTLVKAKTAPSRPIKFGRFLPLREQLLAPPDGPLHTIGANRFNTSFLGSTFVVTLYQCEMVLYGNEGETDTEVTVRPRKYTWGGGGVARHVHPLPLPIM
jgi:hypothetical protein